MLTARLSFDLLRDVIEMQVCAFDFRGSESRNVYDKQHMCRLGLGNAQ